MSSRFLVLLAVCLCLSGIALAQSQSATEVQVAITIPPSGGGAVLPLAATAVIPVTIFSSSSFDATQVDPTSLGLTAVRVKLLVRQTSCQPRDMNADGRLDLICQFQGTPSLIKPDVSPAVLEGRTFNGLLIRGQAMVRTFTREVPR